MAAWRGAQDPALSAATRRVAVVAGTHFAQREHGDWFPGPAAEFVWPPLGHAFDVVAFDPSPPDRAAAADTAYPDAVRVVAARSDGHRMLSARTTNPLCRTASARDDAGPPPLADAAAHLRRHAAEGDFVVLILDDRGGERELVSHLAATGALRLVDEVLLAGSTGRTPTDGGCGGGSTIGAEI
eukprot:gene22715-59521_t